MRVFHTVMSRLQTSTCIIVISWKSENETDRIIASLFTTDRIHKVFTDLKILFGICFFYGAISIMFVSHDNHETGISHGAVRSADLV